MSSYIQAALECLLFVSGEPLSLSELSHALQMEEIAVETALRSYQIELTERRSGLHLIRIAGGWQLATRPEYAESIGRLLTPRASRLSRAALETLAIIAYRQPVTAPEIEAVRGVSANSVLKTLSERRLIMEAGKKEALGRPTLYVTTADFLHYFGMKNLQDLPPLEMARDSDPVSAETISDGVEAGAECQT